MTGNPYQVLGLTTPPKLGRESLIELINGHLQKSTPDHVSVVGPRYYGKSVLLYHLANYYRVDCEALKYYLTTVYIDLRRHTPTDDSTFKSRLAKEIKNALASSDNPEYREYSEYLNPEDEKIFEFLEVIFRELWESDNARMLVVLDGFDDVLAGTGLTRNLWDQLRYLAEQDYSPRLVTGSRHRLRELCKTAESRTSDFWNLFDSVPVKVEALDGSDWKPFLEPLLKAGCTLDNSARKEVENWTGGVPLLVCAVLQKLWEKHRGRPLSKDHVDETANEVLDQRRDLLAALWDDCGVELRADLGALADGDIPLTSLSYKRRRAIESRGFGKVSKNRLRVSCRLIQFYAKEQAPAIADLTRLFGTASGFETHVQSLLELRFKQIDRAQVDLDLYDFVSHAVGAINKPKVAINGIREIAKRALTLIWEAELPDGKLPCTWTNQWREVGVSFHDDQGKLPDSPGAQCNILRLVTGSKHTQCQSQYVKKTTCLLVDHLLSVGDFGQHRQDRKEYQETEISVSFAATVVLAAISLVESLTADLKDA